MELFYKYRIIRENVIKNGIIIFGIDLEDWDINIIEVNRCIIIYYGVIFRRKKNLLIEKKIVIKLYC